MQLTAPAPPLERPPSPPRRRWPARVRWLLAAVLVLAAAGVLVVWWLSRPPAPVSVNDVVDRFRSAEPSAAAATGGPPTGVYVYATHGRERVSAGNVTHQYPARTTLTVTSDPCGFKVRWDALSGRWAEGTLCRTAQGWRLEHYVDVHTFLYMKDVHDYTCSGFPTVVCDAGNGVLTSTFEQVGSEPVRVGGVDLQATHVRVVQSAVGKSTSAGEIEVWVLPSGLPARLEIVDHGSQTVLGSKVRYEESATFRLTSTTPRR